MSKWTEFDLIRDVVTEQELEDRNILHKSWLARLMKSPTTYKGLIITPEIAKEVIEKAGLDTENTWLGWGVEVR